MLKAPDGSKLDAGSIERTTAAVSKLGLSPEVGQSVLEHVNAEVAAYQTRLETDATKVRTVDWVEQTKADPELGGAKFPETVKAAALARQAFFTPAFDQMLNQTGLGNHPEFVRAWARVGQLMGDGKLVNPGAVTPKPERKSTAEVMYGTPQTTT